jgi:hypothetical protein
MAWGYYNLTQGVGHLSWECLTFGLMEQDLCPRGARHLS